jgi:hypothetical protein
MKKLIREIKEGITQITTVDERWYVKQVKDKVTGLPKYLYVPSVTWIGSFYPKGVAFYKWIASKGWDEAEALKNEAADKGSKVHKAIEWLLAGETVKMGDKFINPSTEQEEELSLQEYECLMSFANWFKERKPEVLAKELTVFDEEGFAGTVDLVCKLDGKLIIVDFKTGQNIWPSYELQLSAYKHALKEKATGAELMILQLGYRRNKNQYKESMIEDKFHLFLAAREIWKNECEGIVPQQKDYPLELNIKVGDKIKIKKIIIK